MHRKSAQETYHASIVFMLLAWVFAMSTVASYASSLPEPKGEVVLTVKGRLANHNGAGEARFDRDMLKTLGMRELRTHTYQSKKAYNWRGVLVRDLLEYVGAKGKVATFEALDGYRVEVPVSDYYDYDVILALERDSKELTIRSRGPTRIIYPIDQNSELKHRKFGARYVWQIKSMVVK